MAEKLTPDDFELYRKIISNRRFDPSTVGAGRSLVEEAASDRSRILYSSAFRRLQQKTQVFPLSTNAAVRSRLTHSLEVADVGRLIARSLTRGFLAQLGDDYKEAINLMVETGCLMHDIGNPPFGHFAEVAIQRWFGDHWSDLYQDQRGKRERPGSGITKLLDDFLRFDGNPQGIRMVTRLQGRTTKERAKHGMNLTLSQILTGLKYLSAPSEPRDDKLRGKPGFFESERFRIEHAHESLGIFKRFPLTYIVEAADDISYCLSDMEDGIDKGVLSARVFFEALQETLKKADKPGFETPIKISERVLNRKTSSPREDRDDFFEFKTYLTPALVKRAADRYRERHESIVSGDLKNLFDVNDYERILLDELRKIAGLYLYSSQDVEQPLRVGLQVVSGILNVFGEVLKLSDSDFQELIEARESGDRRKVREKKYDPELLIFDRLPQSYLDIYLSERQRQGRAAGSTSPEDRLAGITNSEWEWFCRAHLILDYLSGMADDFALSTYHELAGISYER